MTIDVTHAHETHRKRRTWGYVYGGAITLLGLFSIIAPVIASFAVALTVGWLLIISGVIGCVALFSAGRDAPGFWWNVVTAVLFIIAGVALVFNPIAGVVTLTIVLAAYLLAAGAAKIAMTIAFRRATHGAWMWILFSAVIDLILGALIVAGLPITGLWVIGFLVGVNLLFTGVAVLAGYTRPFDAAPE